MNNLAEIIGRLIVQVLHLIGNAFLVTVLIASKVITAILQFISSWIEKILNGSGKH